jgi:tRNA pseudouridine55 synthase
MNSEICGILVVDKEKNMTSHDVVDLVRKRFRVKKVGHAGTLDPNATGVLIILLGKATKQSAMFLDQDKEYIATMKLGEKTSTGDSEGQLIASAEVLVSETEIKNAMDAFVGEIEQVPPMTSAKQVNGRRLYKLARKGVEIEREPKKVLIKELEVIKIDLPCVVFRVVCSKGTYIRQLAEDIGERIGCGAYLKELRRTRSGDFSLEQAVPLSSVLNMDPETFNENITRIQERS